MGMDQQVAFDWLQTLLLIMIGMWLAVWPSQLYGSVGIMLVNVDTQ